MKAKADNQIKTTAISVNTFNLDGIAKSYLDLIKVAHKGQLAATIYFNRAIHAALLVKERVLEKYDANDHFHLASMLCTKIGLDYLETYGKDMFNDYIRRPLNMRNAKGYAAGGTVVYFTVGYSRITVSDTKPNKKARGAAANKKAEKSPAIEGNAPQIPQPQPKVTVDEWITETVKHFTTLTASQQSQLMGLMLAQMKRTSRTRLHTAILKAEKAEKAESKAK